MLPVAAAVSRSTLRRWALTALAAATLGLSACGGGDRAVEYKPTAMLVFGDEHSAITEVQVAGTQPITGVTWAIDGVTESDARVCALVPETACTTNEEEVPDSIEFAELSPPRWRFEAYNVVDFPRTFWLIREGKDEAVEGNEATLQRRSLVTYGSVLPYGCGASTWVQRVAASFGLGFRAETGCTNEGLGATNLAEAGDKVADVLLKIDEAHNNKQLKSGVLVTVMVGQNDILELYQQVMDGEISEGQAVLQLQRRGERLAEAVRDVADKGAKVILVKTPNLKLSPFAALAGENSDLLDTLSEEFNDALYLDNRITRLGRSIAGVDTNEVALASTSPAGYTNQTEACDKDKLFDAQTNTRIVPGDYDDDRFDYFRDMAKACTVLTLKDGVNPSNYVWATPIHLGPGAHSYIGSVAFNRAADQF